MNAIDLTGKTALITGASRGIGEATARKFVEYGANVVLLARSTDSLSALASDLGSQALAVAGDVSTYADMKSAVSKSVDAFGTLDVLVNNAGLIDPVARLEDSDPDAWSTVVDVNLKGVYNGMHAAFLALKANGGVIVNISSGAATAALEGWSHYCATKAGVLSLTKCAHKEWADLGIRTVGLSPGTVATDMQVVIKASGINPVSELEWSDHLSPEWVGYAVAWLTTDAAREFDGGDFSLKTAEGRLAVGMPPVAE